MSRKTPFSLPELLSVILGFLPTGNTRIEDLERQRQYVKCALVCRAWADISLDFAWREVHYDLSLLRLLSPIEHDSNGCYYFPHPIDSEGWNQFKKYNQRVKILHGPKTAREKLYYAVASDRPFSVLLPNLREIHGWIDPSFLHLFAHPAIESCYVEDYRHDDEQGLDYVMDLIPLKMPHLRFLSFIEYTNDQIYQEDVNFPVLMRMLKSLPLLREIRLPAIFLTEQVSCALSQHLHLESICAHCFLYTEQDATFAISLPSLAIHP